VLIVSGRLDAKSFISFLQSNKKWIWIQNVNVTDKEVVSIANNIQGEYGMVVSNRSFKDNGGAAAFVIEGRNSRARILADVVVPGEGMYQWAFRGEAAGILASMQLVNAVVQYTDITEGKVKMCCDGKAALSRCFSKNMDTNTSH
jgi:hypothetical protein